VDDRSTLDGDDTINLLDFAVFAHYLAYSEGKDEISQEIGNLLFTFSV
jgi:hypothetical protein